MCKIREIINNKYILYSLATIILALLLVVIILISNMFYKSKNIKIANDNNYVRIDTRQIKACKKEEKSVIVVGLHEKENKTEKQEKVNKLKSTDTSIATSKIKQNATQKIVTTVNKENNKDKKVKTQQTQKNTKTEKTNNNIIVQKEYRGYKATRIY